VWRKVMAAYRQVDDLTVTCRLTACTPGSAPGPTLGVEYAKAFTLFPFSPMSDSCGWRQEEYQIISCSTVASSS